MLKPQSATLQPDPPTISTARALIRVARPKQWVKNVLVFAAPGAAGVLAEPHYLFEALTVFAIFCVTASGTYMLNDSLDAAQDRLHPEKRLRPVAAGHLSPILATILGSLLMGAGIAAAALVASWQLSVVMAIYVTITITYTLWLKHEPVVDLAAVAAGFVLRTIAGGVATHEHLSHWFLIVASFGSLFMVTGKRHAESLDLGAELAASHRPILGQYSNAFLRSVRTVAAAVAITAYSLWAHQKALGAGPLGVWFQLSIVPFVIAILYYALLLDSGKGNSPEEIVIHDRRLQIFGLVWLALFAAGIYA
ncbi:MAG: decaprenyl-phosphate phosphoribosyltransferase [Actinomycetota bacterium]|nr:decaprenyl-phosphate phosphoribosyltransferase [Actinomycetota bacterium]